MQQWQLYQVVTRKSWYGKVESRAQALDNNLDSVQAKTEEKLLHDKKMNSSTLFIEQSLISIFL